MKRTNGVAERAAAGRIEQAIEICFEVAAKRESAPATPTPTHTSWPWCSRTDMAGATPEASRNGLCVPFASRSPTAENTGSGTRGHRSPTVRRHSKPFTATPTRHWSLFDSAIDAYHRSGAQGNLFPALASLAVYLDRVEQPDVAARIYGASTHNTHVAAVPGLRETVQHLRTLLGDPVFDRHVAAGAAMETGDAVAYARQQIRLARSIIDTVVAPRPRELE